jgi:hypothetical protein
MGKFLLVGLFTLAAAQPAPPEETVTVPKSSAEQIVRENIRLREEVSALTEYAEKLQKHVHRLQSSLNCS